MAFKFENLKVWQKPHNKNTFVIPDEMKCRSGIY